MLRQPGSSASSPTGFITAPEMMCPPSSADFSTTVTARSGATCFSRMAAARPAGPAPTISTSVSSSSRLPASAKGKVQCRWQEKAGRDITEAMSSNRPQSESGQPNCWQPSSGIAPPGWISPSARTRSTASPPPAAPSRAPHPRRRQQPSLHAASPRWRHRSRCRCPPIHPETTALAAGASTLDELRAIMDARRGCTLKKRATAAGVRRRQPRDSEIMLVGEGPGEQEDLQGKPFVGRAGAVARPHAGRHRARPHQGLHRQHGAVASTGQPRPSPEEMALCTPFLLRQVELVAPKFLVTLGNVPTKSLFQTGNGITRMRGQWRDLTDRQPPGPRPRHPAPGLPAAHPGRQGPRLAGHALSLRAAMGG